MTFKFIICHRTGTHLFGQIIWVLTQEVCMSAVTPRIHQETKPPTLSPRISPKNQTPHPLSHLHAQIYQTRNISFLNPVKFYALITIISQSMHNFADGNNTEFNPFPSHFFIKVVCLFSFTTFGICINH